MGHGRAAAGSGNVSSGLEEFQDRHDLSFPAFDPADFVDEYLNRTLFYRPRAFTREEFIAFMFAQSKEYPESRRCWTSWRGWRNIYRVDQQRAAGAERISNQGLSSAARLPGIFSSCYLHTRKPEEMIYRIALEVTQRAAGECVFIDDRPLNLENPRKLGFKTIHYMTRSNCAQN